MFSNKTPVTIEPPAPAMPVSGVPGGPGGYGESEVHLLDRLSVLYRYRNIVVAVVFVVLIGGAVQTYTTTKEYKAVAVLQVDPDRPTIQGMSQASYSAEEDAYAAATELNNLRSHTLALRVARKLNLQNNPEFNGQEAQPTGLGDALLSLRKRITEPVMSLFRKAEPAEKAAPKEETKTAAAAKDADSDETPEEAARVAALMGHVTINPVLGARQFTIEVVSRHPQFAADAANAFGEEYVADNLSRKTLTLRQREAEFKKSIDRLTAEIAGSKNQYLAASRLTPAGAYIDASVLAGTVNAAKQVWTTAQDGTARAKAEYDRLAK